MADTNTDAAAAELIEQFKKGIDEEGSKAMAERLLAAEGQLASARELVTTTEEARSELQRELEALKAKPDLADDLATMTDRAEVAESELAQLQAEIARQAGEAGVTAGESDGNPRKLGPLPESKRLSIDELREDIADADTVEILFSDGKREIKTLGVRRVAGDAWAIRPGGLMLTKPVELFGGAAGSAPIVVTGYALLLDGELAAYTARDPLQIPAGGHMRLENDIIF